LAFPNDQDFPAGVLKQLPIAFVPGTVGLNFGDPVCGVGLNLAAAVDAVRTSVPEAAMDEDAHAAGCKDEIGTAREITASEPISKARCMKIAPDSELGDRILAADTCHDLAAASRGYRIHMPAKFFCGVKR
jgi:hypothetical protein